MLDEKNLSSSNQSQEIDCDTILKETCENWLHDHLTYSSLLEDCKSEAPICNQCNSFMLVPDPDPYDWFRDGDKKAVCLKLKAVIQGSLEYPSEWSNLSKPLWCPKLGRKLSEEEKKEAVESLKYAQGRFKT